MKIKPTLIFSGITLLIAVVFGAMGAHYLKETLEYPITKLDSWKTGVHYQQIHGIALLLFVILQQQFKGLKLKTPTLLLKIGLILFSGSIYILAINHSLNIDFLPKIFGPITPIGGLFLISGWITFIISLIKSNFENE